MPNAVSAAGQSNSCRSGHNEANNSNYFKGSRFFGRMCVKLSYSLALSVFEIPSLATECVFGSVGAGVGALVGQVLITARKCMGAKARKFLGLESARRLSDFVSDGFHKGARVGYLPGNVIGAAALFSVGTIVCANAKVALPILGTFVGAMSTFLWVKYLDEVDQSGADAFDLSKHYLQEFRECLRCAHNSLYGVRDIDRLPR